MQPGCGYVFVALFAGLPSHHYVIGMVSSCLRQLDLILFSITSSPTTDSVCIYPMYACDCEHINHTFINLGFVIQN